MNWSEQQSTHNSRADQILLQSYVWSFFMKWISWQAKLWSLRNVTFNSWLADISIVSSDRPTAWCKAIFGETLKFVPIVKFLRAFHVNICDATALCAVIRALCGSGASCKCSIMGNDLRLRRASVTTAHLQHLSVENEQLCFINFWCKRTQQNCLRSTAMTTQGHRLYWVQIYYACSARWLQTQMFSAHIANANESLYYIRASKTWAICSLLHLIEKKPCYAAPLIKIMPIA